MQLPVVRMVAIKGFTLRILSNKDEIVIMGVDAKSSINHLTI